MVLFKILAVWLVFGFLISFPIEYSGTLTFLFVLTLSSWLSYQYTYPLRYFKRAAYLEKVAKEDSRYQNLKESPLVKLSSSIAAVFVAFSAIYVISGFGRISNLPYLEWTLLFFSVPTFFIIYRVLLKKVDGDVKDGHEYLLLWPTTLLNIALITFLYVLVYVFFADLPDIKTLEWSEILAENKALIDTPMPWVGWLIAYDNSIQLMLIGAMQLGSELEISWWVKLAAWLLFVGINGVKIGLVWWVSLGVVSYIMTQSSAKRTTPEAQFSKTFNITLAAFFGFYLLVSNVNFGSLFETIQIASKRSITSYEKPVVDICNPEKVAEQSQQLEGQISEVLESNKYLLKEQLDARIDEALDSALSSPEVIAAIEEFLDWNFSIKGSYLQTFYKGKDLFDVAGLESYIREQFNSSVGNVIEKSLNQELAELNVFIEDSLQTTSVQIGGGYEQVDYSCLSFNSDGINIGEFMTAYGGGGGIAGVMAARVSSKVAAQVSARLASQIAARILAKSSAKLATRAASMATGVGAGALACAATGPVAVACAVGAGAVMWFTADYVIVSVDEFMNRDELRLTIFESIDEQKAEVKNDLKVAYLKYIDDSFSYMEKKYRDRIRVIDVLRQ
jgi:hypothetical protein